MTAAEFKSNFLLICDKVGSPYFSDSEIESFVNRAQLSVLDESLFPKRRNQDRKDADIYGFDNQLMAMQVLQPLLFFQSPVAVFSPSRVRFSDINTASSEVVYRVLNVRLPQDVLTPTAFYNARYVASLQSARSVYSGLRYGAPTTTQTGIYTITDTASDGKCIDFLPALVAADEVEVEFIKTPASFNIAGNVTCELDPISHNEILFRALQLAGISIREDFFYQAMNVEQQKEN